MLRVKVNDTEQTALRRMARQAVGRVSERAHFVLMNTQGLSAPEIGQLMGYDAATVREWLKRYNTLGIAGLEDEPHPGRPVKEGHLTDIVEAQASQTPDVFGYLQSVWTAALLGLHVGLRFGVHVSESTIRRALQAIRFSWHRPKLWPARRRDPHQAQKEARLAEILADPEATVIAEDECEAHLLAVVRGMWQRMGEQVRLPTPGQNARRSLFGGLNLRTGQWHYQLTSSKRTTDFIAFLSVLLTVYISGTIYVIVDNASIHTSRALVSWLVTHPRLQLVYLPTYSGHRLNPVEKVWWQLKNTIAANRNFTSLEQLDAFIHRCFAQLSPLALLALTNCEVNRQAQRALTEM